MDTRTTDPHATAPRAVDLRRGRAADIEILASATYDFLLSLHVCLASAESDYDDYSIGRRWVESARARCAERDPDALAVLGRYLGDDRPASLHATLISLVWRCPLPRDAETFLAWLREVPPELFAEVLLDQESLGTDWVEELLTPALAGDEALQNRLVGRYPEDVRPTVLSVLRDLEGTRKMLLGALTVWYEAVFAEERPRIAPLLQREAEFLERRRGEMPYEPFIEEAMHGVRWQQPAGLRRIVFAPSYFCGPAVFYHYWHGTLTFCAPISTAPAEPVVSDPSVPDEETLHFFLALGDSTRLRILRLLAERDMYLTELAERLELTKATTKHHMIKLRDAGFVTLNVRERLTYYTLRSDIARHATQLLNTYLRQPPDRGQPISNTPR